MKISQILREAAENYLRSGISDEHDHDKETYSCCAISKAAVAYLGYYSLDAEARIYAEDYLNWDEHSGVIEFLETYQEQQQARYAWLHLLAYIAEQEGK